MTDQALSAGNIVLSTAAAFPRTLASYTSHTCNQCWQLTSRDKLAFTGIAAQHLR